VGFNTGSSADLTFAIRPATDSPAAVEDNVMKELTPTGKLRVGVAYAPAPTPIFVAKDAAGDVHGVPRDLGSALAKALGVEAELVVKATTAELTDDLVSGAIDIGFMPADDARRQRVDFSEPYFTIARLTSEPWQMSTGPTSPSSASWARPPWRLPAAP
jgi:ABC-type amino acid transport substrate-binding protein